MPQQNEVDIIISEMKDWKDEPQTLPYVVYNPNKDIFTANTSRENFLITINFESQDNGSFKLLNCNAV